MDRHASSSRRRRYPLLAALAAAYAVVMTAPAAFASSAGMPWESPLQRLVQSLTGPVAKAIGIAAIVITALGMAMSEGGHTMKTFIKILFGLSIAFTAGTFGRQLVGFSGGLLLLPPAHDAMTPLPEGFEVPIHRSLTEPILVAGLPRRFLILLWTPG